MGARTSCTFWAPGPVQPAFDLELALYCLDPEKRWDLGSAAHYFKLPAPSLDPQSLEYQVGLLHLLKEAAPWRSSA